jgi:hypothetical protein
MRKEGDQIIESATEARAARPGRPVLMVLICGVLLVAILYALIYVGFFNFI